MDKWTGRSPPSYPQLLRRRQPFLQAQIDLPTLPLIAGLDQDGTHQAKTGRLSHGRRTAGWVPLSLAIFVSKVLGPPQIYPRSYNEWHEKLT